MWFMQSVNHQEKIQHLDQTITVEKYPKEAGTPEKWPRGANLYYTCRCIINSIQRLDSAHIFLAGSRDSLVLDIL